MRYDRRLNLLSGYAFLVGMCDANYDCIGKVRTGIQLLNGRDIDSGSGSLKTLCLKDHEPADIGYEERGYNLLRAIVVENRLSLYLNGHLVCQVSDGTLQSGGAGLLAFHGSKLGPPYGSRRQAFRVQWARIKQLIPGRSAGRNVAAIADDTADAEVHPSKYRRLNLPGGFLLGGPRSD